MEVFWNNQFTVRSYSGKGSLDRVDETDKVSLVFHEYGIYLWILLLCPLKIPQKKFFWR